MSLNCLLYADDIILMPESEKGLQCCLNGLKSYRNQWYLKVNLTKTKFMVVSKTDHLSKLKLCFGNEVVKKTTPIKLLPRNNDIFMWILFSSYKVTL